MIETLKIKTADILISLISNHYHSTLPLAAKDLIDVMLSYGVEPVITSAFREGDTGSTHGYGRAIDFRSWIFSPSAIKKICHEFNQKWIYDPKRPEMMCLIHHDSGKGPHFHLQVHNNTIKEQRR